MGRFYSFDEIRDAMVVDSEALIYGYVKELQIVDSDVRLSVYTAFRVSELAVDVEKLAHILSSRGLASGNEPLEVLVSIARREGLDMPYRVAEKDVVWLKGFVSLDEVQLIDVKRVSVDDFDSVVKIVLLSTPREASFRGLPVQHQKSVYRIEQILNKLVVSVSRGLLGICKEVVVAPKTVGFRVYRVRSRRRVVNWIAFTSNIKRLGYRDVYERLVEFRDPYRFSKLDLSVAREVENILKGFRDWEKIAKVMESFVEEEQEAAEYEDIAYSDIVKVGDIVIVK
ncbi:MAG: hypothetical protein QXD38_07750 [Ignisphaera sp.]